MLRRAVLILIVFIILPLAGYKLFTSRPDIIVKITGKDLLLKTPLIKLVDIEKLYQFPDESIEAKKLRTQIEQLRSSQTHPVDKERRISKLESELDLLTGKRSIMDMEDAKLLFNAPHEKYSNLDASDIDNFFYLEGPFSFISDDYYFISHSKPDFLRSDKEIKIDGFAVKQVRRFFTSPELETGTYIAVVGRYAGEMEIQIINRQRVKMPLLVDCYVDLKSR